jgi:hypothetical protein
MRQSRATVSADTSKTCAVYFNRQARKKPELDDPHLASIECRECFQCLIERK